MSIILSFLLLAIMGITVVWSVFKRKLFKSRLQGICAVASFIVAIIGMAIVQEKLLDPAFFNGTVLPLVSGVLPPAVLEMLEISPTLGEVAIGLASALIAPVMFVVIYFIAHILSQIAYIILLVILPHGKKSKDDDDDDEDETNKETVPFELARTIIWGAVRAVIICAVILVPVSVYANITTHLGEAVVEADVLGDEEELVDTVVTEYVAPLDSNLFVKTFRTFGGNKLTASMTTFPVGDTEANLIDEVDAILVMAGKIMPLTKTEAENYGDKEATAIVEFSQSFGNSNILTTIVAELAHKATDAWLNGEEFLGVASDTIYFDESGMFDELITDLLTIMYEDSEEPAALCKDIETTAQIVATLIRAGILNNMEDQNALIDILADQESGVVGQMITHLTANDSMKILVTDITNIGVRAIGSTLGIPESAESVYNAMLEDIATELNNLKDKPTEEQVATLTQTLEKEFDKAGMLVDKQVLDYYSGAMIEDLVGELEAEEELTADSVKAFFALYAYNVAEYQKELEAMMGGSAKGINRTQTLAGEDAAEAILQALLIGTVYEGKSMEELTSGGPATLARVTVKLSQITATDADTIMEEAKKIVEEEYSKFLGEDESKQAMLTVMVQVEVKKPVSSDTVTNTSSLQSPETMKETSIVVTMEQLVLTKTDADKINSENSKAEADAIQSIFSTAGQLMSSLGGDTSDINIADVAGSVGNIMDSLNNTASFGDKTGDLFTAVFQSSTVRDTIGIDMSTATQMGQEGSKKDANGNVNYEQTFSAVGSTVNLINKLNEGTITDDELEEVIRNINIQTAGMLKVFVTEERLQTNYGCDEQTSKTAAPLIANIFEYMTNVDGTLTEERYAEEAKALNAAIAIALTARDNSSKTTDYIFNGHGSDNTLLEKTADETVATFMASHALAYSLKNTDFEPDPFGIGVEFDINDGGEEGIELENAIYNYYHTEGNGTPENRETLLRLGLIFGFSTEYVDDILNGTVDRT